MALRKTRGSLSMSWPCPASQITIPALTGGRRACEPVAHSLDGARILHSSGQAQGCRGWRGAGQGRWEGNCEGGGRRKSNRHPRLVTQKGRCVGALPVSGVAPRPDEPPAGGTSLLEHRPAHPMQVARPTKTGSARSQSGSISAVRGRFWAWEPARTSSQHQVLAGPLCRKSETAARMDAQLSSNLALHLTRSGRPDERGAQTAEYESMSLAAWHVSRMEHMLMTRACPLFITEPDKQRGKQATQQKHAMSGRRARLPSREEKR